MLRSSKRRGEESVHSMQKSNRNLDLTFSPFNLKPEMEVKEPPMKLDDLDSSVTPKSKSMFDLQNFEIPRQNSSPIEKD